MGLEQVEEKLIGLAKENDKVENEAMSRAAPQGKFSTGAIKKVCDALNSVLTLFPGAPPCEVGEYEGVIPPQFIKMFEMINAAVKGAGLDELVIDYDSITDDKGLILLAGKLTSLGANSQFKSFLRSEKKDEAAPTKVEEVKEVKEVKEAPSEDILLSRI